MKAIVQSRYGSADVLKLADSDTPALRDNDVLVRVQAAGVDPGVWHILTGLPYLGRMMRFGLRAPKARVRGNDVAGLVEAVGKNAKQSEIGEEVFGTCNGSFAEYVCAREKNLALKPTNLAFEQAAAVPTSALTHASAGLDDDQLNNSLETTLPHELDMHGTRG